MKALRDLYLALKEFSTRYPAVLSGYIIYSYLFISLMQFFFKVKYTGVTWGVAIETFDALPFMWFLSVALVKIIDVRSRLAESEKERILARKETDMKQVQLDTLHQVIKSLQHHINNPLAIIKLTLKPVRNAAGNDEGQLKRLASIDEAVDRINQALAEFSRAQEYATERVDEFVGEMALKPNPPLRPTPPYP